MGVSQTVPEKPYPAPALSSRPYQFGSYGLENDCTSLECFERFDRAKNWSRVFRGRDAGVALSKHFVSLTKLQVLRLDIGGLLFDGVRAFTPALEQLPDLPLLQIRVYGMNEAFVKRFMNLFVLC